MNELSYDVKIWNIETRHWKSKTSYRVTWFVARERFDKKANTYALADSFRSDLITAARRGEAFHRVRGLPVSKLRNEADMSFFAFACNYIDMKWPRAAGKSRAGNADALASALPAMLATTRGKPDDKVLRRALTGWACNTKRRDNDKPDEIERALKWVLRPDDAPDMIRAEQRDRVQEREVGLALRGSSPTTCTLNSPKYSGSGSTWT